MSFLTKLSESFVSGWDRATSTKTRKAALAIGITVTALLLAKCAYDYFSKPGQSEARLEQLQQQIDQLPPLEQYRRSATKVVEVSEEILGFEEGDGGLVYDALNNSIPGTCFEIGAALSILEAPGKAGLIMDRFAQNLSDVLVKVYMSDLGDEIVLHNGEEKTLKQVFDEKLLQEIRPGSDQIGRCTDTDLKLKEEWYKGPGLQWLLAQLNFPSDQDGYSHNNMLTKVRMLSALGTVLRELIPAKKEGQQQLLAFLLGKESAEPVVSRYKNIVVCLRHADFDDPVTRARSERPPIIGGQSVGKRTLQDAAPLRLGFGQVYGPKSFEDDPELWALYQKEEKEKGGRQGLRREGQPIDDLNRPGNVSEYGLEHMPTPFRDRDLTGFMREKSFLHGTGVNRWQVHGSYAKQSWLNGLPSAGSHSGGTVDILLALDCLSEETICGQKDMVLPSGLIIASFMNFGGYHSFNETFPIAQAYAKGERFEVDARGRPAKQLYRDFARATRTYCPTSTSQKTKQFLDAYQDSFGKTKTTKVVEDSSKIQIGKAPKGSWELL